MFKFQNTILRLPAVRQKTGYSRSTIYRRIDQGLFPRQVSLGGRCVGWPAAEVAAVIDAHIARKSNDDIRSLVLTLECQRQRPAQQGVA